MVKYLEIGPSIEGAISTEWMTMDVVKQRGRTVIDFVANLTILPTPIPDDVFDLVYSSHVLEHIPFPAALPAIAEMRRITKPGGAVEIFVPDFLAIARDYIGPGMVSIEEINFRIFNRGDRAESLHKSVWDLGTLELAMQSAGLREVVQITEPRGVKHVDTIGARGIK